MTGVLDGSALVRLGAEAAILPAAGALAAVRGGLSSKDSETRLAIMEALHWDLAIPRRAVAVDVENGWVTLSGSVSRPFARHRADWAARGAPGVAGVTNEITLERS